MEKMCLTCGDTGYEEELVCCFKCLETFIHTYCMDAILELERDPVHWICDGCQVPEAELSHSSGPLYFPKSKKSVRTTVLESEDEISIKKSKKNPTLGDHQSGDGLGKNSTYSFSGVKSEKPVFMNKEERIFSESNQIPAEPLIRPLWTGGFDVWYDESDHRRMKGFMACLSTKSCLNVYIEAAQFQPVLKLEMLPKSDVWPKSFKGSGPTNDDIAVYFFPSSVEHEVLYDELIYEMVRDDVAIRAFMRNTELLIFPSIWLPSRFWRFQGRLYLWGVFRGKHTPFFM